MVTVASLHYRQGLNWDFLRKRHTICLAVIDLVLERPTLPQGVNYLLQYALVIHISPRFCQPLFSTLPGLEEKVIHSDDWAVVHTLEPDCKGSLPRTAGAINGHDHPLLFFEPLIDGGKYGSIHGSSLLLTKLRPETERKTAPGRIVAICICCYNMGERGRYL